MSSEASYIKLGKWSLRGWKADVVGSLIISSIFGAGIAFGYALWG